eukprot:scaffold116294_cov63-Phaeocystis_antarctica.AAC.6
MSSWLSMLVLPGYHPSQVGGYSMSSWLSMRPTLPGYHPFLGGRLRNVIVAEHGARSQPDDDDEGGRLRGGHCCRLRARAHPS